MWNWLREYLEIRSEYKERKQENRVCDSCETLKMQLAIANQEKGLLLNKLLREPELPKEAESTDGPQFVLPTRHVSWRMKQQALKIREREAALAKLAEANAPKPTEQLEEEIGIARSTT